jgi:NTE family protein
VDGGLSSNLPVDVAREMGVDVLIVVDCGFPLLERNKLDSVATVTNQMLAILIRHNATSSARRSARRDVIIDPALGDFSSLDFTEHEKAMKIGEQAARGAARGWRRSACRPRNSSASSMRAAAAQRSAAHRLSCASNRDRSATRCDRLAVRRPGGQDR